MTSTPGLVEKRLFYTKPASSRNEKGKPRGRWRESVESGSDNVIRYEKVAPRFFNHEPPVDVYDVTFPIVRFSQFLFLSVFFFFFFFSLFLSLETSVIFPLFEEVERDFYRSIKVNSSKLVFGKIDALDYRFFFLPMPIHSQCQSRDGIRERDE